MTDSVTVLGRTMPVTAPNAAQLALMARAAKVATAAGHRLDRDEKSGSDFDADTFMTGLTATGQALDIIQKLFLDEMDQEWLTEQMIAGRLDVPELLAAWGERPQAEPVKKVASPKRVRRA